uniref:STAG domain-containing protein n=1 Tax=Stegastes partitus TaxID=144197 RepID=A0A3B4Z989_9TELE
MLRFVLIKLFSSVSPEELDDFSDSGSDYEATIKGSRRRKKPVPGHVVIPLFYLIYYIISLLCRCYSFSQGTVVDEWLDSYKQSREAGLLVLINFIVQSCGCKVYDGKRVFFVLFCFCHCCRFLVPVCLQDSVNYPLCTPGPQLRRLKDGLREFARVLVRSCQNSLIYDEYLFPSLLALLTGLSDSQVRAFRHTSTLLGRLQTHTKPLSQTRRS